MESISVVIVGGGSTYTPDMMETLCLVKERLPLRRLALYDIDGERQSQVGRYGEVLLREYYPEAEFVYTTDPEIAFTGVDFALVQIRAGGMRLREYDEKIPLKYGCVGQETCGAGGFAYGMRSIRAMLDLIAEIRVHAPEAWILNYSNPAAIVAEATRRAYPGDFRILNICDMPIDIMDVYTPLAGGRTRGDVEPRYFGLNHFGWFTHLYDKKSGEDVLPQVIERMVNDPSAVDDLGVTLKDEHWAWTFRHLFKMVRDFPRSLPNTYMQYYLYPRALVAHENPSYTRYNEVVDGRERRVFAYCSAVAEAGKMKGTASGFIYTALQAPLTRIGTTLAGTLIASFFNSFFWIFGIHGTNVIAPITDPIWIAADLANLSAYNAGQSVTHIATMSYANFFIYLTGTGLTLPLAFLMGFRCKSTRIRTVGKISILPGIFNVNEPVIFGLPLVLNPIMIVPFFLSPTVSVLVSYLSMQWGWVPKPIGLLIPWTTPAPLGGWLMTGSWTGGALQIVVLILSGFIYYPFIKTLDKKYLAEEETGAHSELPAL